MCYGMCNCGPGTWGNQATPEEKVKMLERFERRLQEELKEVQEMKKELADQK